MLSMPHKSPAEDQTAEEIIQEMEDLYRGESSMSEISMYIETPQYSRELNLVAWSQGRDYSLIRILAPKKERGISTLKRENEMWNYFPKIDKVIKISPSMMMGSWMGSDFTNDDLVKETSLTEDYELSLSVSPAQYVITLIPKELTASVWGKIEYVIDRKHMIPVRQTFYDEKDEKIRILKFYNPVNYGNRFIPSELEMVPLNKPGNRTRIVYSSIVFNPPDVLNDSFTLRNLKKRF